MDEKEIPEWRLAFDNRQQALIGNCTNYAENNPAGLPGHNLMLIIAAMAAELDAIYATDEKAE